MFCLAHMFKDTEYFCKIACPIVPLIRRKSATVPHYDLFQL